MDFYFFYHICFSYSKTKYNQNNKRVPENDKSDKRLKLCGRIVLITCYELL